MMDTASTRERAIVLMREALALLDAAKAREVAVHLQMALDVADRIPPMKPGDELAEDDAGSRPIAADPALVRAMGGALALFATLLARTGVAPVEEIARLLGIYAVVTGETERDEGLILGCWAAMLRDMAQDQKGEAVK